jgi:putative endonuclease
MAPPAKPIGTKRPEKVAAFRIGLSAESRAATYLVAKGYRILARRWKSPLGEIDIVARRRKTLIFAEVKARVSLDDAAESVTDRQRSRIAAAAEAWIATYPQPDVLDMRFDAMRSRREKSRGISRRRSGIEERVMSGNGSLVCA